jgi:hypothetical protein
MAAFGKVFKALRVCAYLCLAFWLASVAVKPAAAACLTVTPSGGGSQSGADWNNALAGLPGTLTRGDTYYLADGSYSGYSFSTPNSGTTQITIKKAVSGDHCTDTGWNNSTMGSSQAVFGGGGASQFSLSNSGAGNVTLDGNGVSGAPGCGTGNNSPASDCGIKLDGSTCGGNSCWNVPVSSGVQNVTLRYVEIVGTGDAGNVSHQNENIRIGNGATNANFLAQHIYLHDSSCVPLVIFGSSGVTLDHSAFWKNKDSSTCHGQGIQLGPGAQSNLTFSFNSFRDIEGVGVVVALNDGGSSSNISFYGNTIYTCPNNCNGRAPINNGLLACINAHSCTNWLIYQNTIVNQGNGSSGMVIRTDQGASGDFHIINNLWYASLNTPAFQLTSGSTENFNSYLNSGSGGSGSNDVRVSSGAPNPFSVWPTSGVGVFTLTSENSAWTGGQTLPFPYSVDVAQTKRGADGAWDRGAYQFASGSGVGNAPPPPTGLTATVN